ncbi:MAG: hypothetical protein RSE28_10030 [Acinetobacter sp.]
MAIVNSRAAIEPKTGKAAIFVNETIHSLIRKLFANNEQGFAYDPNDLTTMFQDAAGTVPVTEVGQPVGLIRDKSGRNNHAYQTTSASRPILRKNAVTGANYLEFDGSDDFLQTSNIDFTSTDKVSLFAGITSLSNSAGIIAELSNTIANTGAFTLMNSGGGLGDYITGSNLGTYKVQASISYQKPDKSVLAMSNYSQGIQSVTLRRNGVLAGSNTASQGSGKHGNYPLYIGRRGGTSIPFNGHIYGLIGIGKLAADDETAAIEKELSKRVGVTLNV